MKQIVLIAFIALFFMTAMAQNQQNSGKTFSASEKVTIEKVSYKNRYDISVVGDMYLPKDIDRSKKYAAIIVGHPFGGVKEQCAGLYAQELAKRGFIALAFDLSYGGESGGWPRGVASPETYVEDFSASVDFIGTRSFVDQNRIGVIGICGSGGFSIAAAAIDHRIKALATVSMYDMGRERRQGYKDGQTYEQRMSLLDEIGEQRWKEFENSGMPRLQYGTVEHINEDSPAVAKEFYDYYRTPRGKHPNATTGITFVSSAALMNFFPIAQIETVSPRPLLFIAGENAHSRYFSEDAYSLAIEPKELYIVKNAGHVDLYDRKELIPFGKLTDFFTQNLK